MRFLRTRWCSRNGRVFAWTQFVTVIVPVMPITPWIWHLNVYAPGAVKLTDWFTVAATIGVGQLVEMVSSGCSAEAWIVTVFEAPPSVIVQLLGAYISPPTPAVMVVGQGVALGGGGTHAFSNINKPAMAQALTAICLILMATPRFLDLA
jgi:hypothetical protein